ncbi:ABC transporter ATP-binding protein [Terracoccus luteus]|uniref:Energy-coupling factor transport system ATP-binding protein n=1 Tax=Terracoccus luteus TaxID=53356 RepID=A0A839PPP7_9MICO|nr:ABC transporter ATP-binding protein [Terracoccus luteus]MBB2984973.1 energy-coupling factor transport system ATP-binding protein [Terracoccus luteus]MCP2170625.1 energy-coupling factor transport system ATP-binding protein [Terracoccus luteus]
MISFEHVGVTYAGASAPALHDVTLEVPEGELVLVVGPTGSGKSTLLRTVNGLVPHFSGGTLTGRVTVDGLDTAEHRPRDLATVVGLVDQNPASTFVTDVVEDEVAYGMETMGLHATAIRRRVEETLDLFGLTALRARPLGALSGGQQQRVAIASLFAAGPRVLVLDEPTSALDPVAAEEVLASLHRIVHDLGVTVVLAEHRLERVVHHADRVVLVSEGRTSALLDPAEAMEVSQVFPPVVGLSRLAGWSPPPLSVRDARRRAAPLRARLDRVAAGRGDGRDGRAGPPLRAIGPSDAVVVEGARVRRGGRVVVEGLDLTVARGSVTALMGRNGAGKSTLLGALVAQHELSAGRVRLGAAGVDPDAVSARERVRVVGLVPQQPELLLYADTVAGECADADRDFGVPAGSTAAVLDRVSRGVPADRHPRDLSEGQRLELALAVVLAGGPEVLLLDEPTRGLDYGAKQRLGLVLTELAAAGTTVLLATHDVELAAEIADRVVILADGEVVGDGPARDVLAASPAFAPQVTKVLLPQTWLTVAEVAAALEETA